MPRSVCKGVAGAFRQSAICILQSAFLVGAPAAAAEEPAEVVVHNKGIGGNNSAAGLARYQRDVLDLKPAQVILYFGINDALNASHLVPPEQFAANLQAMVERARAAGIATVVLVTPNPFVPQFLRERHPTHPAADLPAHLARYDTAVREVARKNDLPLADLRRLVEEHGGATVEAGCLVRNEANSRSRDGVHLTPEGYRLMAGLFEPIFRGRVKPGDTVVCLGDSITYGAHVRGAGTSAGETYPAWLWLTLNRLVGRSVPDRPPDAK